MGCCGKIIRGAVGQAKNLIHADQAPLIVREQRLAECMGCDKLKTVLGIKTCSECSCPVKSKTKIASNECPIGKW